MTSRWARSGPMLSTSWRLQNRYRFRFAESLNRKVSMSLKHPWEGPANELVPTVKADDMRVALRLVQDTRAEHPGVGAVAIGRGQWKRSLSKGADIDAITYRLAMLGLLY